MKLYVAGVSFNDALNLRKTSYKVNSLVNFLTTINNDAADALGADNTLVLIVLWEYAFTPESIPYKEKKEILDALTSALKQFPNILIVPGSLNYHRLNSLSSIEEMQQPSKIADNYTRNDVLVLADKITAAEKDHFDSIYYSNKPTYIIQNASYLMSSGLSLFKNGHRANKTRLKFLKSVPINARAYTKLTPDEEKHSAEAIFYLGAEIPIARIIFLNETLTFALSICREHLVDSPFTNPSLTKEQIDIHCLISNYMDPDHNKFYGAINIVMDAVLGLQVYCKGTSQFDTVRAISYELGTNGACATKSIPNFEIINGRIVTLYEVNSSTTLLNDYISSEYDDAEEEFVSDNDSDVSQTQTFANFFSQGSLQFENTEAVAQQGLQF